MLTRFVGEIDIKVSNAGNFRMKCQYLYAVSCKLANVTIMKSCSLGSRIECYIHPEPVRPQASTSKPHLYLQPLIFFHLHLKNETQIPQKTLQTIQKTTRTNLLHQRIHLQLPHRPHPLTNLSLPLTHTSTHQSSSFHPPLRNKTTNMETLPNQPPIPPRVHQTLQLPSNRHQIPPLFLPLP